MSAWPAEYTRPLRVYRGDTFVSPVFTVKNPDGTPVDLSEWTDWKAAARSSCRVVPLTVDTSGLAQGRIFFTAVPSETRTIDEDGIWDIQASNRGTTRTWLRGKTKIENDVTR